MEFQISNDQNLGDQFVPINFVWYDCADNSFSDPDGINLYVDDKAPDALIFDQIFKQFPGPEVPQSLFAAV